MAVEIRMPQLGLTMEEGTIEKWFKAVGDKVAKDEALAEISTDKLTVDLESEAEGVILAIIEEEGSTVSVQGLLCIIGEAGEKIETEKNAAKAPEVEQVETPKPVAEEIAQKEEIEENLGRLRISPLAKKVAKEMNVEASKIKGTGPNGRIVRQDVLDYKETVKEDVPVSTSPAAPVASLAPATVSAGKTAIRKPITAMRRVIGKRMMESKNTAPHVTLFTEVNMDKTIEFRTRHNANANLPRLSYTDIIVKMSALALRAIPAMNASLEEKSIVLHHDVNIGVAVALEEGLLVPVIMDADRKGMRDIGVEIKDKAGKAKANTLTNDELTGATFTVSNLGNYDIDGFTPVINLPESAILGVGRIVRKPIVNKNDEIIPANMMTLSLSFDHRLADGALAAQLLKKIKDYLEVPETVLL